MKNYWSLLRLGGVLAGHDFCNYGEKSNNIGPQLRSIPLCGFYTNFGIKKYKKSQSER
jgi:hypothetical protein